MKKVVPILIILLCASRINAQLFPTLGGQRAGITTAQFLKIGVGARASAMGEAFTAVANDASALYWNPAGLAHRALQSVERVDPFQVSVGVIDLVCAKQSIRRLGQASLPLT